MKLSAATKVATIAAVVLVAVALGTGAAIFQAMREELDRSIDTGLQRALDNRVSLFISLIRNAHDKAVQEPAVVRVAQAAVRASGNDAEARGELARAIEALRAAGFAGMRVRDGSGNVLAEDGMRAPSLSFPLASRPGSSLVWSSGYGLVTDVAVEASDVVITLAQQLPPFDERMMSSPVYRESERWRLCFRSDYITVRCYPHRGEPEGFDAPVRDAAGRATVLGRAIAGERGMLAGDGRRGARIVSANDFVDDGLLLSVKVDESEVYEPAVRGLQRTLVSIAALMLLGVVLVRAAIRPHARRLEAALERSRLSLREVEQSMRIAAKALESAAEGVVVTRDGRVESVNRAFVAITGHPSEAVVGKPIKELLPVQNPLQVESMRLSLLNSGSWRGELTARDHRGRLFPVEVSINSVDDASGRHEVAVFSDITARKTMESALRESEQLYRNLFESSRDAILSTDLEGNLVAANAAACELTGYREDELLDRSYEDLTPERWREFEADVVRGQVYARGYSDVYEKEFVRKDGTVVPVSVRSSLLFDAEGQAIGMWSVVRDMTERRRMEEALREALAHAEEGRRTLQAMMEHIPMGIAIADAPEVRIRSVSRYGRKLIEREAGPPLGEGRRADAVDWALLHADGTPAAPDALPLVRATTAGEVVQEEEWLMGRPDGSTVPVLCTAAPIRDGSGRVVGGVMGWQDISDLKRTETALRASGERLEHLATHDSLTGLPNRRHFRQKLDEAIGRAERHEEVAAVLFVDLDGFKPINDSFGHDVGDELLRRVARRLGACVRKTDTIARFGGDEFTVLLETLKSGDEAGRVAETVREALARPFTIGGRDLYISGSVGISCFPADGRNAEALLVNADAAMYKAKSEGKNGVCYFSPALDEQASRRLEVSSALRDAIDRDELELHYQPRVSLTTDRVLSVEALLRWHSPRDGLLAPADFLDIAEESGLIVRVGEWVLQRACLQMNAWREAGVAPDSVAINVSAREFEREDFVDRVLEILRQTGTPPSTIELEITESVLAFDPYSARAALEALRVEGIRTTLDDFGSGSASLSSLRRFPISQVKIDRVFVQELVANDQSAIARSLVDLAKAFDMEVTAEGVETEEQRRFLIEARCDAAQGFLFSRAVRANELFEEAPLKKHTSRRASS